ncbi:MAG: ABC transporter ATP-binding protein [Anaerovoracaceae bacterium]
MIEIKNITKKYGKTVVLKNMNYRFKNNGITCLLGASGSGKTTLLNLLAGFDTDYEGEIYSCGEPIKNLNANALCTYRKNTIGFIFQDYNLIQGYSVLENILLAAELNNKTKEENKAAAVQLMTQLGIDTKIHEKVENLSGGQKQRVAIARALINDPKILFADEPTGALDRETATEIMLLLKELSTDRLILVITHDQKICTFADEVLSILEGKSQFFPQRAPVAINKQWFPYPKQVNHTP